MRAAALRARSRAPRRAPVVAADFAVATPVVTAASCAALACALLAVLLSPTVAHSGPWLRQPGETYAKAAFFQTHGTEQFDASGSVAPLFDPDFVTSARYDEHGGSVYVEHGLYRDFTLVVDALFKTATLEADGLRPADDRRGTSYGIPDLRVGGRVPLSRGPMIAALEGSVGFPLRAVGRSSDGSPQVGTPSASFALAVSAGASISALRAYAQGTAGYRARAGREPGEWLADAEVGATLAGPLSARVRVDALDARGVDGASAGPGMPVPETGGQDLRRIAPTLALSLGGGEIGVTWRRAFGGRSSLRSTEWELSYSFLGVTAPR